MQAHLLTQAFKHYFGFNLWLQAKNSAGQKPNNREKRVKSIMRILTDPALNNVVKSVSLCHSALGFFKGQDHYLDMGGKLKASMEVKTQSIFHRKRCQAKVSHWWGILLCFSREGNVDCRWNEKLHDLIINVCANKNFALETWMVIYDWKIHLYSFARLWSKNKDKLEQYSCITTN